MTFKAGNALSSPNQVAQIRVTDRVTAHFLISIHSDVDLNGQYNNNELLNGKVTGRFHPKPG